MVGEREELSSDKIIERKEIWSLWALAPGKDSEHGPGTNRKYECFKAGPSGHTYIYFKTGYCLE